MAREYAGSDLAEIRRGLFDEGFTEISEDHGDRGFDAWRPFSDLPQNECVHVVVWPINPEDALRSDRLSYWMEEY